MKNSEYRILICEDELIVAEFIKETLQSQGYQVIGVTKNKADSILKIQLEKPNLVLLDINMDEPLSGVKIAQHIQQYNPAIDFIFITAFSDVYTLEQAIATQPQGYLVKPIDKATLLANIVLSKFKKQLSSNNHRIEFPYQTENGPRTVFVNDLIYVESAANYCEFVLTDRKKQVERLSMASVSEQFESHLVRIHKSYCVNPDYINRFTSLKAILKDGTSLPIGRKYKEDIKLFFE